MTTRSTSRAGRAAARASVLSLVNVTLMLGAGGCSSERDGAPAQTPDDMSNQAAGGSSAASADDAPALSASGETDITDLAPSNGGTGSGQPTASTPDPGETTEPGVTDPPASGAAVPSAGCGQTRTLQNGNQTLASGGVNRTYFLQTPSDYDNTHPHRVVFMFHWNYGSISAIVNPPDADRNTDRPYYGFGDLTDGKTIFVVPQGLISPSGGAGWENPNNRDVNFTDDMLAAISSDLCIDTSRVFTTGFSYGAGMSIALACTRPDKFRAAAVYAAAFISGVQPAQCTTPIAFFEAHGVDDPIINYQTGLNVLNTFSALNGCTAMTPPNPASDAHACASFEGCSVPTRFCTFGAGQGNPFNTTLRGHYPSAKDPGQTTSWIPAEAWSFITQF